MNFLHDKRKSQKRRRPVLWLVAVIIFAGLVTVTPLFGGLSNVAHRIGLPIWTAQQGLRDTGQSLALGLRSKKQLIATVTELEQSILEYESEMLELRTLRAENESLRTVLNRTPAEHETVAATVLARPSTTTYDTLVIDAGRDHGVSAGDYVTTLGNVILGTVVSTQARTAKVDLFSLPRDETRPMVVHERNLLVDVIGKGAGNYEIHAPQETDIQVEDIIVLPQFERYIVGIVKDIQFDPRDPFQTVYARTPINLSEIRYVEVILDEQPTIDEEL